MPERDFLHERHQLGDASFHVAIDEIAEWWTVVHQFIKVTAWEREGAHGGFGHGFGRIFAPTDDAGCGEFTGLTGTDVKEHDLVSARRHLLHAYGTLQDEEVSVAWGSIFVAAAALFEAQQLRAVQPLPVARDYYNGEFRKFGEPFGRGVALFLGVLTLAFANSSPAVARGTQRSTLKTRRPRFAK